LGWAGDTLREVTNRMGREKRGGFRRTAFEIDETLGTAVKRFRKMIVKGWNGKKTRRTRLTC